MRWMTGEAVKAGLLLRPRAELPDVDDDNATGDPHSPDMVWRVLGTLRAGPQSDMSIARRDRAVRG